MHDALDFSSDSEDVNVFYILILILLFFYIHANLILQDVRNETLPQVSAAPAVTKQEFAQTEQSSSITLVDEPEDNLRQLQIQNRYFFWFMHRASTHKGSTDKGGLDNFEQALIPVASFQVNLYS